MMTVGMENVDRIKNKAIAHYRDWHEEPPITDEEHIAYAQWRFFVSKEKYIDRKRVCTPNWNLTIIQSSIDNCSTTDYYNDWSRMPSRTKTSLEACLSMLRRQPSGPLPV